MKNKYLVVLMYCAFFIDRLVGKVSPTELYVTFSFTFTFYVYNAGDKPGALPMLSKCCSELYCPPKLPFHFLLN